MIKNYEISKIAYYEYQRIKEHLGHKPNRAELFNNIDEIIYQKIRTNTKYNLFRDYFGFLEMWNELSNGEKEIKEIAGDFLNTMENTRMSKTYKIPLLKAFIKENSISLKCSEDDIYKSFKEFYTNPENIGDMLRHNKTKQFERWGKKEYLKLAKENPIKYLIKTEGDYFKMENDYFCLNEQLKPVITNKIFVKNYEDILEFRRLEYFKHHSIL
jgi:hypothetical protein